MFLIERDKEKKTRKGIMNLYKMMKHFPIIIIFGFVETV